MPLDLNTANAFQDYLDGELSPKLLLSYMDALFGNPDTRQRFIESNEMSDELFEALFEIYIDIDMMCADAIGVAAYTPGYHSSSMKEPIRQILEWSENEGSTARFITKNGDNKRVHWRRINHNGPPFTDDAVDQMYSLGFTFQDLNKMIKSENELPRSIFSRFFSRVKYFRDAKTGTLIRADDYLVTSITQESLD